MERALRERLECWANRYNDPKYFEVDPIVFPRYFADRGFSLRDVEIAAVFAAHFAWGRRQMIVRDCSRLFEEMSWRPYDYVMKGNWRSDETSAHRTVKWSEVAAICGRLKTFYDERSDSLETLDVAAFRSDIFGQKPDRNAPNKKINMLRRWMVRCDGKVDLGLWRNTDQKSLLIPLDVHVYNQAFELGLTDRKNRDVKTARQITDIFKEIFPSDPLLGDFALFGYGVSKGE